MGWEFSSKAPRCRPEGLGGAGEKRVEAGGGRVSPRAVPAKKLGFVSAAGVLVQLRAQPQHQELGPGVCLLLALTLRSGQVLWPCSEWR